MLSGHSSSSWKNSNPKRDDGSATNQAGRIAKTDEDARETPWLFVYGTLRRGFSRHGILKRLGARLEGKGIVPGELLELRDYPGARPAEDVHQRLVGEVYRLPNPARAFRALDQVEGYREPDPASSLFRREIARVTLENGKQVQAWVYWLNRAVGPIHRIRSGDYARKD